MNRNQKERFKKSLVGRIVGVIGGKLVNTILRAHHVLAVIGRLYEIERAAQKREVDTTSLQSIRAEHAAPLLTELKQWLDNESFLPKSQIGKAATFTRNQWEALNRYVKDEILSIDNNEAERAMRAAAIGRKNWCAPDVLSRISGSESLFGNVQTLAV